MLTSSGILLDAQLNLDTPACFWRSGCCELAGVFDAGGYVENHLSGTDFFQNTTLRQTFCLTLSPLTFITYEMQEIFYNDKECEQMHTHATIANPVLQHFWLVHSSLLERALSYSIFNCWRNLFVSFKRSLQFLSLGARSKWPGSAFAESEEEWNQP